MEKYEINKFIEEYNQKLDDLYAAFNIKDKEIELVDLDEKIQAPDFWNDQKTAQAIIAKANQIKEITNSYNDLKNKMNDIVSLVEMAIEDNEAMELLESLIKEFIEHVENIEDISILEDSSVEKGGVIVETDFGSIDARISSQLTELENKILEVSPLKSIKRQDSLTQAE